MSHNVSRREALKLAGATAVLLDTMTSPVAANFAIGALNRHPPLAGVGSSRRIFGLL